MRLCCCVVCVCCGGGGVCVCGGGGGVQRFGLHVCWVPLAGVTALGTCANAAGLIAPHACCAHHLPCLPPPQSVAVPLNWQSSGGPAAIKRYVAELQDVGEQVCQCVRVRACVCVCVCRAAPPAGTCTFAAPASAGTAASVPSGRRTRCHTRTRPTHERTNRPPPHALSRLALRRPRPSWSTRWPRQLRAPRGCGTC
jgi:hypothetical protein